MESCCSLGLQPLMPLLPPPGMQRARRPAQKGLAGVQPLGFPQGDGLSKAGIGGLERAGEPGLRPWSRGRE